MAIKTLQQAENRLIELREKRKAIDREIEHLRYLIADLSDTPLKKDLRERDRQIYLEYEAAKKIKRTNAWVDISSKYRLGPDRVREIHKQQKALIENKEG